MRGLTGRGISREGEALAQDGTEEENVACSPPKT